MGEMKVYRGKKNHKDLARLIAYNGDTGKFTFLFSYSETFFQQFTNKQLCCVLESDAWDEDECNQFVGTDTTIIPPLIAPEKGNRRSKGEKRLNFPSVLRLEINVNCPSFPTLVGEVLWGFDPSVCRSIGMSYANKKFKLNGIPIYVYDLDIDADINKKACFCRDEENCPPKGKLRCL